MRLGHDGNGSVGRDAGIHNEHPNVLLNPDAGLHVPAGQALDRNAYDQYIGRWSRLFVPSLLKAAEIVGGHRVLDVATGSGEAAVAALLIVGDTGIVVGADVSPAMVTAARARLPRDFLPMVMNGQSLALRSASFDAVICQLGLMFFPDAMRGLAEFRRVLCPGRCASVCVISERENAPMWGILADAVSRQLPAETAQLNQSFRLGNVDDLKWMFHSVGFHDVRVWPETQTGPSESFDEYWAPIEAGVGLIPQLYRSLPVAVRGAVRNEVRSGLSRFEQDGRLVMSVEMLIGCGRA